MRVDVERHGHGRVAGEVLDALDVLDVAAGQHQIGDVSVPQLVRRHLEIQRNPDVVLGYFVADAEPDQLLFAVNRACHLAL